VEEMEGRAIEKMSLELRNKKGARTKTTVRDKDFLSKDGKKYAA